MGAKWEQQEWTLAYDMHSVGQTVWVLLVKSAFIIHCLLEKVPEGGISKSISTGCTQLIPDNHCNKLHKKLVMKCIYFL